MASLNAGPEYYAAEGKLSVAKTPEEKLAALSEMLRFCPKHKGSQSILLEIRRKISDVKKGMQLAAKKKAGKKGSGDFVKKQGAAQIALLGLVNSGKTALYNRLCGINHPATMVEYETQSVTPGMMDYDKIQLQILDLPSITEQNKNKLFAIARMSDLALIILDPLQNLEAQKIVFSHFEGKKLVLISKKNLLLVGSDLAQYDAFSDGDILLIKKILIKNLELIRVFTKTPRGDIDKDKPFVMISGSTVQDIAKQIHKDLYTNLKYARVWGSARFSGQQVSGDFILKDGDIVELHMK